MKQIIVISDLHIGEGTDSPLEDFFYQKELVKLLKKNAENTELIINGDFVDFLQITQLPKKFKNLATKSEEKYGLKTSPEKSAWKIKYVIKKHPALFKALAEFTEKNKIFHLRGNHDIDFFWPEVQKSFHKEMKIFKNYNEENFKFLQWFYYKPKLLWIEHGNQYDNINSFCNLLHPVLPRIKELELPLGSFFCRYIFNKVEKYDTFADNIKPPAKYFLWTLKNKPMLLLKLLKSYFPLAMRVINKSRVITHNKKDRLVQQKKHEKELKKLSKEWKIPFSKLKKIDKLRAPQILEGKNFLIALIKGQLSEEKNLINAAEEIKKLLKVKYVIFGHTHVAEHNKSFINTGTWTPIVKEGELKSINESKKLTYVLIKNNKAELKEWK